MSASTVLSVGFRDIQDALVRANLVLVARVLVHVRGYQHRESFLTRRQRYGSPHLGPVRRAVSTISTADWSMRRWSNALSRIRIRWLAIYASLIQ